MYPQIKPPLLPFLSSSSSNMNHQPIMNSTTMMDNNINTISSNMIHTNNNSNSAIKITIKGINPFLGIEVMMDVPCFDPFHKEQILDLVVNIFPRICTTFHWTEPKQVYYGWELLLHGPALKEWQSLVGSSSSSSTTNTNSTIGTSQQEDQSSSGGDTSSMMSMSMFQKHQKEFILQYFSPTDANQLLSYMYQVNKPKEMTPSQFIERMKILNQYVQLLHEDMNGNLNEEQFRLVIFMAMPLGWRQDYQIWITLYPEHTTLDDLEIFMNNQADAVTNGLKRKRQDNS